MTSSLCFCAPRSWQEAGKWMIQLLFVKPLRGLGEILRGLNRGGRELLRATASAAVSAVWNQLGADGEVNVRQGLNQVLAGAQELIPLSIVAVLIWSCWNPSVLYLLSAVWVLAQLVCVAID